MRTLFLPALRRSRSFGCPSRGLNGTDAERTARVRDAICWLQCGESVGEEEFEG